MQSNNFNNNFNNNNNDEDIFELEENEDGNFQFQMSMETLMSMMFQNSTFPFGCQFENEEMEDFLKTKGYKITRLKKNPDDVDFYTVATLGSDDYLPEVSNLDSIFKKEVRKAILKWLKKIK